MELYFGNIVYAKSPDALVLENMSDSVAPLTPAQAVERFCYAGDDRNIYARFVEGKII